MFRWAKQQLTQWGFDIVSSPAGPGGALGAHSGKNYTFDVTKHAPTFARGQKRQQYYSIVRQR